MARILHIETATRVCSVALAAGGEVVSLKESSEPNVHSSLLTVFIEQIFRETGIPVSSLDAVAVSKGPGSYTGLRIGVAAAKGLCYATDRPLIAVPTLGAMAYGISLTPRPPVLGKEGELYCPMLDARRMEVYCAVYDRELRELKAVEAVIVTPDSFDEYLRNGIVTFGGEGAEKCRPLLEHHPNARFVSGFEASAKHMVSMASERYDAGRFEDLAYFEPFYLKEFIAGKPRVKGLR